jgi:hypothetical protein
MSFQRIKRNFVHILIGSKKTSDNESRVPAAILYDQIDHAHHGLQSKSNVMDALAVCSGFRYQARWRRIVLQDENDEFHEQRSCSCLPHHH